MKGKYTKLQRRLALAGAIFLILLYVSALVFSLSGSPLAPRLLTAAIFCTVAIPAFLYAFILAARMTKKEEE